MNDSFNVGKALDKMYDTIFVITSKGFVTVRSPRTSDEFKHVCAGAVRQFVEAGGIRGVYGDGYRYAKALESKGFTMIKDLGGKSVATIDAWCKANAKEGDVCGMSKGQHLGEYGHVAMFDGKDWISDCNHTYAYKKKKQKVNSPYVYRSEGNPSFCKIYRFGGQVINDGGNFGSDSQDFGEVDKLYTEDPYNKLSPQKKNEIESGSNWYERVYGLNKDTRSNKNDNIGFYYDTQLNDPSLTITLHPNTIQRTEDYSSFFTPYPGDENKKVVWDYPPDKVFGGYLPPVLTVAENPNLPSQRYCVFPIAKAILTEDMSFSMNNGWTDFNNGNPIKNIFDTLKPYAPLADFVSEELKKVDTADAAQSGSFLAGLAGKLADGVKTVSRNASSLLNKALIVQGTQFTYYNGSSFSFNNLELKFLKFSDYDWRFNGKKWEYVFYPVTDYITECLAPYAYGRYQTFTKAVQEITGSDGKVLHPAESVYESDAGWWGRIKSIGDEIGGMAKSFANKMIGFQNPPGGFKPSTKSLDNALYGTLRLNIGTSLAVDNLIISNISVVMSKMQMKHPDSIGKTVPMYAEITISLKPACMISDRMMQSYFTGNGMQNIQEEKQQLDLDGLLKKQQELQKSYEKLPDSFDLSLEEAMKISMGVNLDQNMKEITTSKLNDSWKITENSNLSIPEQRKSVVLIDNQKSMDFYSINNPGR